MSDITHHTDYRQALASIKQRIQISQTRAVLAVNAELLHLYWDIGRQLDAWQRERAWGSAVVEQMALDLQASYPGMKGFSRTSLFAMRQFYAFFSPQFEVVPQPVGQMPWGHVRTLLAKVKSVNLVLLYQRFSPDSVNGSDSTAGLKRNLEKDDNKIVVTTIQKLNNLMKSEADLPIYLPRPGAGNHRCHHPVR